MILCLVLSFIVASFLQGYSVTPAYAADGNPDMCIREWYDEYAVVADAMDITMLELLQHLEDGHSIADTALELDIATNLVIDALVEVEIEFVQHLHDEGCLTDAEVDVWIAGLPDKMAGWIELSESASISTYSSSNTVIYLPILMN